ncbi:MAG: glycosyltransferase family 4 protein [Dysgonomonas sp.]
MNDLKINNPKMKVIVSTGQGRLHLIESARALLNNGMEVSLITGWIPSSIIPDSFVNFMGKMLGRKNLSYGMNKRKIEELSRRNIHTCTFSEFFIQFLFLCSKYKIIKNEIAEVLGWKLYGWQSKKYITVSDIFHVRSGAGQGGAIKKAKRKGIKVLVDHSIAHPQEVYDQLLKANNGNSSGIDICPSSPFWQLILKDCFDADGLLVNSNYVRDSFIKNGYPSNKIYVAELGVRSDFIGLKNDWKIKSKLKLLFTGGFGKRKGAMLIIECVHLLIEKNIDFELNVVGSINDDTIIPDWIKSSDFVKLHGHVPQDELKKFFIMSDIYIFPSYSEGAAQSLKEAMGSGLPAIATIQSGVEINDGETGILIPDNSSEALFQSIIELAENEAQRKKIGLAAIEEMKKHTWDSYARKLEFIYSSMA